jgi:hypothetical protein
MVRTLIRLSILPLATALALADAGLHFEAQEIVAGTSKQVAVNIKNPSRAAGAVGVHVYFIGRAPSGGPRFIYADSELSVHLKGATEANAKVAVPDLKSDPNKHAPVGFVLTGVGTKEGWIVIGQMNGKTFQALGSNPGLLDVAQGKARDSLNAMIKDYEKRMAAPARRP